MEKKILLFIASILLSMASVFAEFDITLSSNPPQGGFVSGGGNYTHGETITIFAIPDSLCYTFINWSEDGVIVTTSPFYTFPVTQSRNLVANFVETGGSHTITVMANPAHAGTILGTGAYSCGTIVTMCVTPYDGYQFINWTENGIVVSTDHCYTFPVFYPRNLIANFALATYNVTVTTEPSGCGEVTGGGANLPYGTSVALCATPSICCDFLYWAENGVIISVDHCYAFPVTRHCNLIAHFAVKTYDVIISSNLPEGGTISGGGNNILCGDSTFVWAVPNPDYEFVNWTEDDIEISNTALHAFPVLRSHNLVANFEKSKTMVAVTETIGTSAIKIYPNPTSGELKVVSSELKVENIEIYDAFGKKVGVTRAIAPETAIDISHLSAGVYFVKVITDAGEVVQKVVKE
ncbi:MAG: T9SS type A sorting domain-containing protein [Bacteroidetes bacterium]|nr:T9SS type A sorting domain-containing protein [Bacteroidota bacterium]MCL2303342.1 T9SS type A sorting domain-containing protein [Lentimicrobiaceae bacterium]